MSGNVEARLKSLGIILPPAPSPAANYVPALIAAPLLVISGQLPRGADGSLVTGRLGADLTIEAGQAAARLAALNILAHAQAALGTLDRVVQVVRVNGFVNATAEFADHPKVINGASDLMVQVFGDIGRHTRIAVGAASLPANAAVEIDAIFTIQT